MTEHKLLRIEREPGQTESRFHYVCSCGSLGPDHGAMSYPAAQIAQEWAEADHRLHAEGKPVGQGKDNAANPEGRPWSERMGDS